MKYENGAFIYTTIHEFKNNISAYIRLLEQDVKRGVVIMRRNEEVALFQALKSPACARCSVIPKMSGVRTALFLKNLNLSGPTERARMSNFNALARIRRFNRARKAGPI